MRSNEDRHEPPTRLISPRLCALLFLLLATAACTDDAGSSDRSAHGGATRRNDVRVFVSDRVGLSDAALVVGDLRYEPGSDCFILTEGSGRSVAVVWPPGTRVGQGDDVGVLLPDGTVLAEGARVQAAGGYHKFGVAASGFDAPEGFEECAEVGEEFAVVDSASL